MYLVNVTARILGFILRIDHSLDKDFKRIVISKYVGLGSIIQATPLLQTLRKKFPGAHIVFVTTSGGKMLLQHIPEVNEIICVSDKNFSQVVVTTFQLLRRLWKIKPDLYIDLEFYSNYGSIVTTLSKATNRLGFYKEDMAYRKGVYNYLLPFNINVPISQTYLQFAKRVHCEDLVTTLKIAVENKYRNEITSKTGIVSTDKYIVVNPNASDLRLERRWPKSYFIKTIIFLLEKYKDHLIVLIGDKTEAPYVSEIVSGLGERKNLVNTAGRLNLSELIELIAGAGFMLTNDTGPMHIAFATGIKTVSLFGPCSPLQYGGTENTITFYKKVHCSPCVHKYIIPPCHGDNQCMKQITAEEVMGALEEIQS